MALFLSLVIIDKTFYIEEFLVSSWRIMIVLRLLSIFLGSPYLWFWICGWPVRRLTWWWAIYHCTDSAIGQEASWTVIQGFIKSSLPFSILVSDSIKLLMNLCLLKLYVWLPRWCYWERTHLPMQETQETQETQVWPLGWEDPLEEGMQPTPVILLGESHGQRSLAGNSPQSDLAWLYTT